MSPAPTKIVPDYEPRRNYTPIHYKAAVTFFEHFVPDGRLSPEGIDIDVYSRVLPFLREIGLVTWTDRPGSAARVHLGQMLHRARAAINSAASHTSFDPQRQFKVVSDGRSRNRSKRWIIVPIKVTVQRGPLKIAEAIGEKVKSSYRHHERDRIKLAMSLQDQFGRERAEEMLAPVNLQYEQLLGTLRIMSDNMQRLVDFFIKHENRKVTDDTQPRARQH